MADTRMVLRYFRLFLVLAGLMTSTLGGASESDFGLYYGPNDPEFIHDQYQSKNIFLDTAYHEQYIKMKIEKNVFDLETFFRGEFYNGLTCPDHFYKANLPYMTYLNRLITISYLFEALQDYQYTAKQFGSENKCQIDWSLEIKKCAPKSKEMITFLRNFKQLIAHIDNKIVPFDESTQEGRKAWIDNLNSGTMLGISQFRLKSMCKNQSCKKWNESEVTSKVASACRTEREMFESVCSEKDRLFGLSQVNEVQFLIGSSNATRAFSEPVYARGCLERFAREHKKVENKKESAPLRILFPIIYETIIREKSPYVQGRIFSVGALREFTAKGLDDLFEVKPEVKAAPVVAVEKEIPKPHFDQITIPLKKIEPVKKVVSTKKILPPKVEPDKSAFLISSLFREKINLSSVEVDMRKFKNDFIFTISLTEKLKPIVEKFSSYKSLQDMKKLDFLGSQKAPMPLKFIKYLIDMQMHKEIYNITNVLSSKFYVRNDIDKNISKTEYIEILNNEQTGYKWQINILAPAELDKKN